MTVPTPIVEWAPAKGPYETVDTYLNLTGAANTFAATPTEPNYSGSGGTYQIVVRVAADDYTPASTQDLMSVYNATSQRSWKLSILASGALQWTRSTNGTTDVTQASSVPSLSGTAAYWLGVEYVTSTGAVAFYRAADSQVMPTIWSGWTLISSHVMTSGIPFASSARLVIGADDAGSNRFIGRIYEARLYRIGLNASFFPDRDGYAGMSSFASQSTLETYTLTGAATLTGDWADISTDVQAGTVTTGRQYELDRFNSGSASITWVSESRLFDFDNSASTYFGQLQPMRQFRIRMRRNDQVWPIFRGYCIDWDQTTDSSDNVFFTTVRLADAFALLDATAAPSPYESAVLAKSPTAYFRLHDTNSIPARKGGGSGVWSSTPTLTTPLIANDASSSWSVAGGIYGKIFPFVTSADTCIEFWMSTTATTGTIIDANAAGIRVLFYLAAGKLRVYRSDTGRYYETTNVVNTGTAQNIYFNFATNAFVINGVADAGTNALNTPDELGGVTIETGVWYLGTNQARTYPYVGVLDELAIYSTNVGNNYTVGTTPWSGQTTGARVAAILDAIGWPAALRDIDTGDSTMQTADIASETALGAIQQAADTELGQTFIDEYGNVHHRSRSNLWLQNRSKTSQVTFNDSWSGTTKIYSNQGFSMVRDALLLRNPVTASRANGTTITRQDDTLITTFGRRDYQAPVSYDSSDVVISDRAEFLLSRYKNLQTRLESMTVNVHRDPADLTATIGTTTIGTRITVRRKPLNTGSATSVDQIVEGISHRFAPRVWSTTFRASPLERTIYFILDDATFGVLDDDLLAY